MMVVGRGGSSTSRSRGLTAARGVCHNGRRCAIGSGGAQVAVVMAVSMILPGIFVTPLACFIKGHGLLLLDIQSMTGIALEPLNGIFRCFPQSITIIVLVVSMMGTTHVHVAVVFILVVGAVIGNRIVIDFVAHRIPRRGAIYASFVDNAIQPANHHGRLFLAAAIVIVQVPGGTEGGGIGRRDLHHATVVVVVVVVVVVIGLSLIHI